MENSQVALIVDDLEEKAEVTPVAASSKETKAARNSDSSSEINLGKTGTLKGEEGSSENYWSTKEITFDSHASLFLKWKKIFLASCVFAVLLDPLFLYIPIINNDSTCLEVDEKLKITALILRSLTDLFYIMEIALQFYRSESCSGLISRVRHRHCSILQILWKLVLPTIAKTVWHSYIWIDILAILPLPQVLILIFFSKLRGLSTSTWIARKVIMNLFVLMQYFPRILRIYLCCKELRRTHNGGKRETATWVKGVLNFFMYILASHVLGAVWYFFAIQRMMDCWQYACGNRNECDRTFGCQGDHTFRNMTYLNDFCPISTPSTSSPFDFGIYTTVLQSGLTGSTQYLQKLSNCFCWGLRNLSSLGSNLQPSINTWENLFVAFISIIGLLLFIYLIGNLQTYMQLDVARIEEHRHKMKVERKIEEKSKELEMWLSKNGIPERSNKDIKLQIMKTIRQELEEDRDVQLGDILSIIPLEVQNYVKSCMPLTRLKQVPMVHSMDGLVLKEICELLKPMKYSKNEIIIREDDDSLKMMLFIVEGNIIIEKPDHPSSSRGAGELYGEKLLTWPSLTSFPALLPSANESVKAMGGVEALILMASDMERVGSKFSFHFRKYNRLEEQLANLPSSIRVFTLQDIKKATNNFHRVIGQGGCGTVYKGTLADKKEVAIKVLIGERLQTDEFNRMINRMIVLSQINHRNLVRLLGCCMEIELQALVLEFVNNGTLYDHIHATDHGKAPASWELRMNLAVDSARGLQYLHYSTSMPIIHGDVKSSNILVDENFTGKVSDFDASDKLSSLDFTTQIIGTLGYLDPEYLITNRLTEKSDVYSFGVVLLELITSRRVFDFRKPEEERNLVVWFLLSAERGCSLDQFVDSEIINEAHYGTVKKVADLARRCLRLKGEERPTMKEVAIELESLQIMAKHPDAGEAHSSPSEYLLGSPSYVYGVDDVTGELGSQGTDITAHSSPSESLLGSPVCIQR